jgi:hypothetical protein
MFTISSAFLEMIKNDNDLIYSYLAIFAGCIVGFGSTKLLFRLMDQNVLTSCQPVKIMIRESIFGERLFCDK